MLPSVLPTETDHVPVLADEVLAALDPRPGETVIDCTFGAGGHAAMLAARLRGEGKLIAIDRDPTVEPYFERVRRGTAAKARLLHGEFSTVLGQLADNGVRADAILLDLGVSSMQLDRPERGFSYAADAPLDMRMDPSAPVSAREVVNETDERGLEDIFRRYGEERYARQIARAITRARASAPIDTTLELVEVVASAQPAPARFAGGHPAKRTFQAIRIAVNDELGQLDTALPIAWQLLAPGGRMAAIAFHSLEDRRVKQFLAERASGCSCPPDLPVCVCGREPEAELPRRRAIFPSAGELASNPRAGSARLRSARKLETGS
jgi:16S rRNA (cytosine1402-N4)-methyltransferase